MTILMWETLLEMSQLLLILDSIWNLDGVWAQGKFLPCHLTHGYSFV